MSVNSSPTPSQPNNPLHGVTLEAMLHDLLGHFGWTGLAEQIQIRCFTVDPSMSSSLKFLRRTPWARSKVENLYLGLLAQGARQEKVHPYRG